MAGGGTRLGSLAPPVDVNGPRVRLGVAWATVTAAALALSPVVLAVWMALVAALATSQIAATWRRRHDRPHRQVAMAGALIPLAGLASPVAAGVVAVVMTVTAVVLLRGDRGRLVTTLAIGWWIGTASAAPVVVANRFGIAAAVVLLFATFVYDASAYIVGSGTAHRWEGVAAGVASVASLSLAVAAVLVPPFRGLSPWILGGVAAALLPLGPFAGTALLGPRRTKVPALRRLDSLLVAGPGWALTAALVL